MLLAKKLLANFYHLRSSARADSAAFLTWRGLWRNAQLAVNNGYV